MSGTLIEIMVIVFSAGLTIYTLRALTNNKEPGPDPYANQRIGAEKALKTAEVLYYVITISQVALYAAAGYLIVNTAVEGPSPVMVVTAIMIGVAPGIPPIIIGKVVPSLIRNARIPERYLGPSQSQVEIPTVYLCLIWGAIAVGVISYAGSTVFSLSNMITQTAILGFDSEIFGIPSVYLIPASLEIFQLFLLLAIVAMPFLIVLMKANEPGVSTEALEQEIARQEAEATLAVKRARANTKLGALLAEAERAEQVSDVTHRIRIERLPAEAASEAEALAALEEARRNMDLERQLKALKVEHQAEMMKLDGGTDVDLSEKDGSVELLPHLGARSLNGTNAKP